MMIPWSLVQTLLRIAANDEADVVLIPFNHYIMGDLVDYSGWGGTALPRFFKRGTIIFRETIHRYMDPDPAARICRLPPLPENMIEHFCYRDAEHFLQKLNPYTTAEALGRFKTGQKFRWWDALVTPLREFQGRFFNGQGWRGGFRGFALCVFMAFYRFASIVKLWEMIQFEHVPAAEREEKIRARVLAGHPPRRKEAAE